MRDHPFVLQRRNRIRTGSRSGALPHRNI